MMNRWQAFHGQVPTGFGSLPVGHLMKHGRGWLSKTIDGRPIGWGVGAPDPVNGGGVSSEATCAPGYVFDPNTGYCVPSGSGSNLGYTDPNSGGLVSGQGSTTSGGGGVSSGTVSSGTDKIPPPTQTGDGTIHEGQPGGGGSGPAPSPAPTTTATGTALATTKSFPWAWIVLGAAVLLGGGMVAWALFAKPKRALGHRTSEPRRPIRRHRRRARRARR